MFDGYKFIQNAQTVPSSIVQWENCHSPLNTIQGGVTVRMLTIFYIDISFVFSNFYQLAKNGIYNIVGIKRRAVGKTISSNVSFTFFFITVNIIIKNTG